MDVVEAVKQLLLVSGAGWVLWLLGVLSVATVAVAVERWLSYRGQATDVPVLARHLDALLARGAREAAAEELAGSPALAARVASAGLRLSHLGPVAAERAMDSAVSLERQALERRLAFLGTVGNNAPFIGLFGTVVGVVHAFEELGRGGSGHASTGAAAAAGASQAVMTALAEALVATAVGIAVALPAIALYNALQRRVATLLQETDAISNLTLAYLSAEASPHIGGTPHPAATVSPLRPPEVR
ncbi:MAG TPA: MotA/TolQ/ExbB proton channel family protein [Anaeromyxobacteraceae bacterium]|jgi:biopolymer transport protein ExbB